VDENTLEEGALKFKPLTHPELTNAMHVVRVVPAALLPVNHFEPWVFTTMRNPQDPSSFNHQSSHLSTGRKYHYVDERPTNYNSIHTPVLLLVHGFPDFWCVLNNLMGK